MQGFSAQHTVDVTLSRGDDRITFTLYALPPGFRTWLRGAFPPPKLYERGKAPVADDDKHAEWGDRYLILLLGKALEPGNVLTTPVIGKNVAEWLETAKALLEEFRVANLTDGDLQAMRSAMTEAFFGGPAGN